MKYIFSLLLLFSGALNAMQDNAAQYLNLYSYLNNDPKLMLEYKLAGDQLTEIYKRACTTKVYDNIKIELELLKVDNIRKPTQASIQYSVSQTEQTPTTIIKPTVITLPIVDINYTHTTIPVGLCGNLSIYLEYQTQKARDEEEERFRQLDAEYERSLAKKQE